ncbi:hypothetical protein OEA41_002760 [Lepraria neglecta]|uniref:NACHT domain-containing protein n=1 Tax=Lepraria neglecta TaxID=209136 RepID=A0AAD9Z783_9LECA|nr:hypothetical protein OEA41_002760 [Lepraria neglecta]
MEGVVRRIYGGRETEQLVVLLAGKSFKIREAGEKVIEFIWESKELISSIASVEPHADLAFSGVMQIFPLLLNQKEQNDTMVQGLEKLASLIRLYRMREAIYINRQQSDVFERHTDFENAVIKLYYRILEFQARLISYLWKGPMTRLARNTVKADDWRGLLDQIDERNAEYLLYTKLLDKQSEQLSWKKQYSQTDSQIHIQQRMADALNEYRREREEDRNECCNVTIGWEGCLANGGPQGPIYGQNRQRTASNRLLELHRKQSNCQEGRQTGENALKAVTHQLLKRHPTSSLIQYALPRYVAHGDQFGNMFGELWSNLLDTLKDPANGEVICVLDALDECTEPKRKELLEHLIDFNSGNDFLNVENTRLKLLITSRPYHDIEARFARLGATAAFVQIDGDDKAAEISEEINFLIDYQVPRAAPDLDQDDQMKIARHLRSSGHRTYLWVHLMLNVIEDKMTSYGTEKKIKAVIDPLPQSINEAYDEEGPYSVWNGSGFRISKEWELYVFVRYAAVNWIGHYGLIRDGTDGDLLKLGLELCETSVKKVETWWTAYYYMGHGWVTVVERLIDDAAKLEDAKRCYGLALISAFEGENNDTLVDMLLKRDLDINVKG